MKKIILVLSIMVLLASLSAFEYTVELHDSWGDGWNGGLLDVLVNGDVVLPALTIEDGTGPESHTFEVVGGDAITTVYTAGSWPYENSYIIYNQNGVEVAADGLDGEIPTGITTPIIVLGEDDVDLGVTPITGNITPTIDTPANFSFGVVNNSAGEVATYTVKFMELVGEESVELTSADLGPIAAGATVDYEAALTFDTEGEHIIYGVVINAEDISDANNTTPYCSIDVQPSGTTVITIGAGTVMQHVLPTNYFYKNALSEQIYYASELQVGGVLNAIDFFYNFADIPVISDLNVWVGETTLTDLSAGFIPSTELTPVYSGPLDFVIGEGVLHITFDTPYAYGGGNLVVLVERPMDTEYYSSSDNFYSTPDEVNTARSIYIYSDTEDYDPVNPPANGIVVGTFANAAFYFIIDGMGSITGTVTSNGTPVDGAAVSIDGTPAMTYTNAEGVYTFPYVMEGDVSITASKHGYYDGTASATVVEDQTTTADITMEPLPMVMVSGNVFGSDYPENGIADAVVELEGYEDYEAMTDADGHFEIAGVYASQTYDITVHAEGYETYTATVEVGTTDLVIDDITVLEIVSPATNVVATPNAEYTSVDVTWEEPTGAPEMEFRYDDGIATAQLGFGANEAAVLGGAHFYDAVISEVSWLLTSNSAHAEAKILIFGLDAAGVPDDSQLLYESGMLPNVDDQWNTYTLESPVEAPNGFFVGVCTPGIFTSIGTDDGVGEPYEFQEGTQWGIADYTAGTNEWLDVGPAGFPFNFTVRAYGQNNGEISYERTAQTSRKITELNYSKLSTSIDAGSPVYKTNTPTNRIVETYDVYRLLAEDEGTPESWTLLAEGLTELNYTDDDFASVPSGVYEYAVVAVFTNGVEAPAAFSNEVASGVMGTVTFEVTTNDGVSAEGAMITFTAADGDPEHVYETVVGADGTAVIENVWFETYTLEITLSAHDTYVENNITFDDDMTIQAELAETLSPVAGLDAEVNGTTVTLTWADPSAGGDDLSEDFEAGIPADWTILDEDGDTYSWELIAEGVEAHEGIGAAWSASYINNVGALTPDNYLITPQIALGATSELNFWVRAQDDSWPAEHYYVKVSTSGTDAADFANVVYEETLAAGDWHQVTVDLSGFAGQQAYIAWEHCEVTDMYYMKIDDVAITNATRVNRAIESYIVKRDGEVIASDLTETTYVDEEVAEGEHTYSVAAVYTTGTSEYSDIDIEIVIEGADDIIPLVTELKGNYPNPFNPTTTINYDLAKSGDVNIEVYNVKGQLVKTLVNGYQEAAAHTVVWNGKDNSERSVASGVYFYKMQTSDYKSINKMILMK